MKNEKPVVVVDLELFEAKLKKIEELENESLKNKNDILREICEKIRTDCSTECYIYDTNNERKMAGYFVYKEYLDKLEIEFVGEYNKATNKYAHNKTKKELLEKYKKKMNDSLDDYAEEGHINCDECMCELLIELGFKEVVDIYEKQEKWYS